MNSELIDTEETAVLPPAFGGQMPKGIKQLRSVIQTAMDAWLSKTESERTKRAYRRDVEQFLEYLGLNPEHIENMTRILPEDVCSATISLSV